MLIPTIVLAKAAKLAEKNDAWENIVRIRRRLADLDDERIALERELEAFEQHLRGGPGGAFCYGDQPTMADCLLVPQLFNAQRFNVPLDGLPLVQGVWDACMALDAFSQTQPSACPDAEAC